MFLCYSFNIPETLLNSYVELYFWLCNKSVLSVSAEQTQMIEEADFLKSFYFQLPYPFAAAQNAEASPSGTKIEAKGLKFTTQISLSAWGVTQSFPHTVN